MSPEEAYREAQRRISVTREAGTTHLDLGDLPLDILPRELADLRGLRILSLGKGVPSIGADGDLIIFAIARRRPSGI